MTDYGLSEEDYPAASAIRETLREFLSEISDELHRSTVEQLVFEKVSLADSDHDFNYKSEEFTRRFLIDELLEAVELQYRPQPKASGSERDHWPDFELSNTAISVVGEIKPFNDISRGENQIKTYLSVDDFDTPYGILTDGMEWRVYGPDRSTSGYTVQKQTRLNNAFQMVAEDMEIIRNSGLSSAVRNQGVKQIGEFVQTFKQQEFNDWMLISLPRAAREQYLPDDYESQASFEDFQ